MTPFEVVYGRPPPTLHRYLPGEFQNQAVAKVFQSRDAALAHLRFHLQRAQQKMTAQANKHRRAVEFQVGEFVYLKYRPFRQSTLFKTTHCKLAPRYFGPFEIEARIGAVAYRLKLPQDSKIHPVFHVSLLKKVVGDAEVEPSLPPDAMACDPPYLPEDILGHKLVDRDDRKVQQILIKWCNLSAEEATWMDIEDFKCQFPYSRLVDKAVSEMGGIVNDRPSWQVYTRSKHNVVDWK